MIEEDAITCKHTISFPAKMMCLASVESDVCLPNQQAKVITCSS
jgi:hypothetical protein